METVPARYYGIVRSDALTGAITVASAPGGDILWSSDRGMMDRIVSQLHNDAGGDRYEVIEFRDEDKRMMLLDGGEIM